MKVNDYVVRLSHNKDVVFKIIKIENNIAVLCGVYVRLIADSPIGDLEVLDDESRSNFERLENEHYLNVVSKTKINKSQKNGRILHLDSDQNYLNKCLDFYKQNNISAYGVCLDETNMQHHILDLISFVLPDIVVLTGHDSFNNKDVTNLNNYSHTLDYISAVKKIREKYSYEDIFIYAGACGSNFEALIASGANYASSITRENIDAYDPAIVAYIAATTRMTNLISLDKFKKLSKSNPKVIGGIDSYGKMRLLDNY